MNPSRKRKNLIISAIIAVSVIFLAFFVKQLSKEEKVVHENTLTAEIGGELKILSSDTDNDGLKDWEESLWKTDINKIDTDGDGTNDSDEIKEGRDPAKKGPDDKFTKEDIENKLKSEDETEENMTETEKFSIEFFANYMTAYEQGKQLDQNEYEKLLEAYLEKATTISNIRFYGASDFKIINQENTAVIKDYGNKIAEILMKKPGDTALESELLIIDRYNKSQDPSELEKLDPLIKKYTTLEDSLKNLSVPKTAIMLHIELINAISATKDGIEAMRIVSEDPLKAVVGINSYTEASQNIVPAILLIKKYLLEDKKVTFAQGEDGYIFFNAL